MCDENDMYDDTDDDDYMNDDDNMNNDDNVDDGMDDDVSKNQNFHWSGGGVHAAHSKIGGTYSPLGQGTKK